MVLPVDNPTKSYWIEAAESPLRNFRSTEELPAETDVVVVGSGYAGASTAYWLTKYTKDPTKRPRVTLLEARDICGSATGRNGGHLRPHAYSRYIKWSERFGPDGAMELIRHEVAHLRAFRELADVEGIAEEVCLQFDDTFDAAMTEEAWMRLKGNYEAMKRDHGVDNDILQMCRLIEDAREAEQFSQMKGARGCVVHPAGQIWPYKFVHALLRILLETGTLNLQAHTPAQKISKRDAYGWITVTTDRGEIRTRAVVHTTNRWASHLLPEFTKLITGDRATIAAIRAPEGFIKHSGAQHWDGVVNNYHNQLPPPYNIIILGGGRQSLVHRPEATYPNDDEHEQIPGIPEFFRSWPESDVVGWKGSGELARAVDEGGCWTGVETETADSFPFIGPVPDREGHFIAAGFVGHGMPRILGSTAHLVPLVLESTGVEYTIPEIASTFPVLPAPFLVTAERVQRLRELDVEVKVEAHRRMCGESAKKEFCGGERCMLRE